MLLALLLFMGTTISQATELTVVTYNVWALSPFLVRPSRLPDIAQAMPGLGADVIGFQEAFHGKSEILAELEGYPHHAWGNRAGSLGGDGLLLVSRHPIVESSWRSYTTCSWDDCLNRKGALHARVRIPDGPDVDFFVTHTNAHDRNEAHRLAQVQELSVFVAETSGDGPVVLLGDFNTWPGSDSHRFIEKALGARDAHAEYVDSNRELPQPERDGYTWAPGKNTNIPLKGRSQRLDYLFVRDGASGHVIGVRNSEVVLDEEVRGRHLSDHFALRVALEIGAAP